MSRDGTPRWALTERFGSVAEVAKERTRRPMRKPRLPCRPHVYVGDGITDQHGNDRCTFCGLAEARTDVHTTDTEVAGYDARRLGEHEEAA